MDQNPVSRIAIICNLLLEAGKLTELQMPWIGNQIQAEEDAKLEELGVKVEQLSPAMAEKVQSAFISSIWELGTGCCGDAASELRALAPPQLHPELARLAAPYLSAQEKQAYLPLTYTEESDRAEGGEGGQAALTLTLISSNPNPNPNQTAARRWPPSQR